MHFSSRKGFTLVELLISVAIIALVTTMVLVQHNSFDSTVLLKSAAYDIAISLREAQVKSLSQVRSGSDQASFNYPYGLSFTPESKTYIPFIFKSETLYPNYSDGDSLVQKISSTILERSIQVSDVCVVIANATDCTTPTRLDVSFRRPEYRALFYVAGYGTQPAITSAKIKVNSTKGNGTDVFVVDITSLGQISVSKE